ncbi:MAG: hypothetical protein JKY52_10870 [Flavobacteriales bacterium]|nr:hypothetical protein [Flavobacteriales bacterium]
MRKLTLIFLILLPFLSHAQKGTITVKKQTDLMSDEDDWMVGAWKILSPETGLPTSIRWVFNNNGESYTLRIPNDVPDSLFKIDSLKNIEPADRGSWLLEKDTLRIMGQAVVEHDNPRLYSYAIQKISNDRFTLQARRSSETSITPEVIIYRDIFLNQLLFKEDQ